MKVTGKTLALLNKHNIFTGDKDTSRIKIGDIIQVDKNSSIEEFCGIFAGGIIPKFFGSYSYSWSPLSRQSYIGRYSSIANNVRLMGVAHDYRRFTSSPITYDRYTSIFRISSQLSGCDMKIADISRRNDIKIENDVWIGYSCQLKPGITIGDGAVIATGAVVTKSVHPFEVWGGISAKPIKSRFTDEIISDLMELKWWEYNYVDFKNIVGNMPVRDFIDCISSQISDGSLKKYSPKVLTGEEIIQTLV